MPRRSYGRLCRHACTTAVLFSLIVAATASLASAQTVSGRVVDPDARPVAGAQVIVTRQNVVIVTDRTNADGRFGPLRVTTGDYDVAASAPGLRAPAVRVTVQETRPVDVDVKLALSAVTETVVVSAASVETTLSRVTDSVTILDRAYLDRRQAESLPDALRIVPGLGTVTSGGRGALTSLFPRGGESDYTLVLVDGIAHNAFGGFFDAAHLGTADIDRIEVVRGPQSALFGGGAIGSVVHVITKHSGPITGTATFEGGGQDTIRAAATTSGSRGAWRWGAGIDGLRTEGDTREFASIGGRVANDDYDRISGSASLGWSDRASRRARIDVRLDDNERGFPGPYGADPADAYFGLDLISRGRNRTTAIGGSTTMAAGGLTHGLQFSYAGLRSRFVNAFGESEDKTRRLSGRYQSDMLLRTVGVSAGLELTHERADNTFITGELAQPVPVRRLLAGWFVEGRHALGARGVVHAGVRVERIARTRLEADPNPFGPRPAFDDDVVWSINPKISAAWMLRPAGSDGWTKVRAAVGTGIKPPTAFDIAFTDNPGLKPERSRSFDAGIEHAFLRSRLVADATWFANRYDDLIITVGGSFSGASRFRTDNIANARSRGLETGLSWQPAGEVNVRASWTWLDTEVLGVDNAPTETALPFSVGDPLFRRPRHRAAVDLGWATRTVTAFLSINGRGKVLDLEPNAGAFGGLFNGPGYVTVSAGGSVRVVRGVDVTGRVTNLFDRDYEEVLGFPALGRSFMVGVRVAGSR